MIILQNNYHQSHCPAFLSFEGFPGSLDINVVEPKKSRFICQSLVSEAFKHTHKRKLTARLSFEVFLKNLKDQRDQIACIFFSSNLDPASHHGIFDKMLNSISEATMLSARLLCVIDTMCLFMVQCTIYKLGIVAIKTYIGRQVIYVDSQYGPKRFEN